MIRVSDQNTQLGRTARTFSHRIAGKGARTAIQFPVTGVGGYTSLIGGNRIPEKMHMGAGCIGKVPIYGKSYHIMIISQSDGGDFGP